MAEGLPQGPGSAAPPEANFEAGVPLSSERRRELGRDTKRHVVSTHLLAPPASYVRGKSLQAAEIPTWRLPGDGEDGRAGKGRLRRGQPASSSAGNLFFLLPPASPWSVGSSCCSCPTVEHRSGGVAPSSQAPCATRPCCEHRPRLSSGSCRWPPRPPSPPRGSGLRRSHVKAWGCGTRRGDRSTRCSLAVSLPSLAARSFLPQQERSPVVAAAFKDVSFLGCFGLVLFRGCYC